VHKKLEDHYSDNPDVVHLYVQTVFEGASSNTYESGLRDLEKFSLKGPYGFDVRKSTRVPTMRIFRTHGTPWTVVLSRSGTIIDSANTPSDVQDLIDLIDGELSLPQAKRVEAQ
jgi:hypothetical protein